MGEPHHHRTMAEVIHASGDDWREIERRASLPEGHVERALLEILQRLVPVENQVVPVGAAKMAATSAGTHLSTDAAGRPKVSMGEAVKIADAYWGACEKASSPHLSTDAAGRPEVSFGEAVILAELEAEMAAAAAAARAEVARQQGEAV